MTSNHDSALREELSLIMRHEPNETLIDRLVQTVTRERQAAEKTGELKGRIDELHNMPMSGSKALDRIYYEERLQALTTPTADRQLVEDTFSPKTRLMGGPAAEQPENKTTYSVQVIEGRTAVPLTANTMVFLTDLVVNDNGTVISVNVNVTPVNSRREQPEDGKGV